MSDISANLCVKILNLPWKYLKNCPWNYNSVRENFSCMTYVKVVKSVREKRQIFISFKKMFLLNKQNSAKTYPKFNIIYYRNSVKLNHSFSLVSSHILTKFTVYSSWKPSNQQITGFVIAFYQHGTHQHTLTLYSPL